jgi:organic hydroperoxide reductase OsmC/OhrA
VSEHRALVRWEHAGGDFRRGQYLRRHAWHFDCGVVIPAAPALSTVPEPLGDASCVDPEEALVAAIASCHMLTFLHLAARAGFAVTAYEAAVGVMTPNDRGVPWVSEVHLAPCIRYADGHAPEADTEHALHADAHAQCFIAQTLRSRILVHGREPHADHA